MTINTKLINAFLNKAEPIDLISMQHRLHISEQAKELFKNLNISRGDFAKILNVKIEKLTSYFKGTYNYNLDDMCRLNSAWKEYATTQLDKEKPVQFSK
jgi:hypothetical protein